MARAIFLKDFSYSSRKRNVGWHVKASPEPQTFPRELIDAALARKTVAIAVPTRRAARLAQMQSGLGQAQPSPESPALTIEE